MDNGEREVNLTTRAIALDVIATELRASYIENIDSEGFSWCSLQLPWQRGKARREFSSSERSYLLTSELSDTIREILAPLSSPGQTPVVVFGVRQDPFVTSRFALQHALRITDALATASCEVVIQTRSPLLLLVAPLLRKMRDRLIVNLCHERYSDAPTGMQELDDLPRASERFATAQTLQKLGIKVVSQLMPYLPYTSIDEAQRLVEKVSGWERLILLDRFQSPDPRFAQKDELSFSLVREQLARSSVPYLALFEDSIAIEERIAA